LSARQEDKSVEEMQRSPVLLGVGS
jgi:hypothetical protein